MTLSTQAFERPDGANDGSAFHWLRHGVVSLSQPRQRWLSEMVRMDERNTIDYT